MSSDLEKVWCVDCVMSPLPIRHRVAKYPGPRCYTHWKVLKGDDRGRKGR
jgi:hypothetical protein